MPVDRGVIQMMVARWLVAALLLTYWVPELRAQSLDQVARAEAARRAALTERARTLTNRDLATERLPSPSGRPQPTVAQGENTGEGRAVPSGALESQNRRPVEASEKRTEQYWRVRFAQIRNALDRAMVDASALQTRVNELDAELSTILTAARKGQLHREREGAMADLGRFRQNAEALGRELAALEARARQVNVPFDWTR